MRLTEIIKVNGKEYVNIKGTKGIYANAERKGAPASNAIVRLAAYEDAEEQGLLVRLPCKVGDTVFLVEGHSVYKSQVDIITLHDACNELWLEGTFNHFGLVYFSGEIGRNVFLTREEAEAALKGGQGDV